MDRLPYIALGFGLCLALFGGIWLLRHRGLRNRDGENSLESLARQATKALRDWTKTMARTSAGPEYAIHKAAVRMYDEAQMLLARQLEVELSRALFNRFITAWNQHEDLGERLVAICQKDDGKPRRRRDRLELVDLEAEKLVRAGLPVPLEDLLREARRCLQEWTKADEHATETYESVVYQCWLRMYDEIEAGLALSRHRATLRRMVEKIVFLFRERVAVGKLLLDCMKCYQSPVLLPREERELLDMQVEALVRAELLHDKVPTVAEVRLQFLTNFAQALLPLPAEHSGSKILAMIEPEVKLHRRRRSRPMQAAAM